MSSQSTKPIQVLVLGGWSPGPLTYLQQRFQHKCRFLQPNIPMPPQGCIWCFDITCVVLLSIIALTAWGCHAIRNASSSRAVIISFRIILVLIAIGCIRVCIAWIVRRSIAKGSEIAHRRYLQTHDVKLILGFSWGAGVATHMIHQRKIDMSSNDQPPAVLLLAPTTLVMDRYACQKKCTMEGIRVPDSRRAHVFHATYDGFCPHPERWDSTGFTTHMCEDCHIFSGYRSKQMIGDVMEGLIALITEER